MKTVTFFLSYLLFALVGLYVETVKREIIKEVNICKRYDPHLRDCYCSNYVRMIPLLKDGIPEMTFPPIDPFFAENVSLDLRQSGSVSLVVVLSNVYFSGLSTTKTVVCEAFITSNGLQLYFELHVPVLRLKSKYNAKGKVFIYGLDASGDFDMELPRVVMRAPWNTTGYMKNGKKHLKFTSKMDDLYFTDAKMHFTNLFGNNTALNDNLNQVINENMDVVYNDIKTIFMETINNIALSVINEFYAAFPFDVLFPK